MRLALTLFLAFSMVSAAGCAEDDAAPAFASLQWLLRCRAMGGCTGYTVRDINQFNGEMQHRISCSIENRTGGKELFFSAFNGNQYGIDVRNLLFQEGTDGSVSVAGGTCSLKVLEDGIDFVGECGPNAPSVAQPCQFTAFTMDRAAKIITGEVRCENLRQQTAPTVLRELTGIGSDAMKIPFEIRNCKNL